MALLNQQTASLRAQLDELQGLLDAAEAEDAAAEVQIETLGAQPQRGAGAGRGRGAARGPSSRPPSASGWRPRRRIFERYRSEFFGRMREILGEREGVQVVGDRFVFPSEVLFAPGSATLGPEGQAQVARVAEVIREIADEIPRGHRLGAARRRPHRQHPGQRHQPVRATTGS